MPDQYDVETQPFTDGTGTNESYSRPLQSRSPMPPLNLSRAQHILDRFTEDPSWLANPRTAHAANAIFSAASKVVGMGIQMERVQTQADAVNFRLNTDRRLIQDLNHGTSKIEDLATVSAIREEVERNGPSPLAISLMNSQLRKEAEARARAAEAVKVEGRIDVGEARHENRMAEIEASQGGRGGAGVQYPEPTIKDVGGKSFMFYRNFSPKPLDRLTPQQQQMLNVNVAGLKEARKKLTDATDDTTREDAQKVYNRELTTFNEFFDMVSPKAVAAPGTNAPAATAPTNPAAQKADEANKIASENPGWTRQQIIDEVNRRFAR